MQAQLAKQLEDAISARDRKLARLDDRFPEYACSSRPEN